MKWEGMMNRQTLTKNEKVEEVGVSCEHPCHEGVTADGINVNRNN